MKKKTKTTITLRSIFGKNYRLGALAMAPTIENSLGEYNGKYAPLRAQRDKSLVSLLIRSLVILEFFKSLKSHFFHFFTQNQSTVQVRVLRELKKETNAHSIALKYFMISCSSTLSPKAPKDSTLPPGKFIKKIEFMKQSS